MDFRFQGALKHAQELFRVAPTCPVLAFSNSGSLQSNAIASFRDAPVALREFTIVGAFRHGTPVQQFWRRLRRPSSPLTGRRSQLKVPVWGRIVVNGPPACCRSSRSNALLSVAGAPVHGPTIAGFDETEPTPVFAHRQLSSFGDLTSERGRVRRAEPPRPQPAFPVASRVASIQR